MISEWDRRFLSLAEHIAGWSKDPGAGISRIVAPPSRLGTASKWDRSDLEAANIFAQAGLKFDAVAEAEEFAG